MNLYAWSNDPDGPHQNGRVYAGNDLVAVEKIVARQGWRPWREWWMWERRRVVIADGSWSLKWRRTHHIVTPHLRRCANWRLIMRLIGWATSRKAKS